MNIDEHGERYRYIKQSSDNCGENKKEKKKKKKVIEIIGNDEMYAIVFVLQFRLCIE